MKLDIRLTKVSPTHHRFECVHGDGIRDIAELETKSFLFHDLLHFAYESEARLQHSFYGLLASGVSYEALSGKMESATDFGAEILHTERVVGPLTSVVKGAATPKECMEGIRRLYAGYQEPVPRWLSEEFILKVQERMRRLVGQWEGTEFGKTMKLRFEV